MAFIPEELRQEVKVSTGLLSQLAKKEHVATAMRCAEVLCRRYEKTGRERRQGRDEVTERRQGGGAGGGPANGRELSVPERRRIERSEWRAEAGAAGPGVPPAGPARRRWLYERLRAFVVDELEACPEEEGASTQQLLTRFEWTTGPRFAVHPGIQARGRTSALFSVLKRLAEKGEVSGLSYHLHLKHPTPEGKFPRPGAGGAAG